MIKKIASILVMVALGLLVVLGARNYKQSLEKQMSEEIQKQAEDKSGNIVIWYSYEYYTDYLEYVAESYKNINNIDVTIKYVSSTNMLEAIEDANEADEEIPDLFITGSENLEKAYLLGLCQPNTSSLYTTDNYPQKALNAASYNGKLYAYPIGFETAAFVYNKAYVTDIPTTFDDIKTYADNFDSLGDDLEDTEPSTAAEEEETTEPVDYSVVESILVWDADSMLYNYGFIGSYISFSGTYSAGDESVNVDETRLVSAMQYYKALYDYFSVSNEADKYDQIVDDFAAGKIVFTILNIESLREIDESDVEYGVCKFPQLSEELGSANLALTDVVVVNPYSNDLERSEEFAKYLSFNSTYKMYEMIGILPAKKLQTYGNDALKEVADQYGSSVSLPRMLRLSDYWLKVENLFKDINKELDIETTVNAFIEDITKVN